MKSLHAEKRAYFYYFYFTKYFGKALSSVQNF